MASSQKYVPYGTILSDNTISAATTLTVPDPSVDAVMIQCLSKDVRFTADGVTVPTTSTGFLLVADQFYILDVVYGKDVQVIETAATATIIYQWLTVGTAF